MTGSLVDMFPPEMQTIYGAVAGAAALAGLCVWAAGIKIARASLAVVAGAVVAGICVWSLPGPTHISPMTAAIIGFVAGVLAGAVTFRFLQGLMVAACLALVAGGIYYRVQVARPAGAAATMPAAAMLIPVERLGKVARENAGKGFDVGGIVGGIENGAAEAGRVVIRRWNAVDLLHRQRMALLVGATALAALLLSLFFPRHTTWIMSAAVGTFILVAAGVSLVQVFAPQYEVYLPIAPLARWGTVAIVMLLGMLTQRRLFWSVRKTPAKADPGQPAQN